MFGAEYLKQEFERIRQSTLALPRTSGQLRQEICEMREKMYQHLSSHSQDKFHIKTDQGGITDIEFIAQYLVLAHSNENPQMAVWSDNADFRQCG